CLASASGASPEPRCTESLEKALTTTAPADLPLLLDAIAALPTPELDAALKEFAADDQRPLSLRLKALNASTRPGAALAAEAFRMLLCSLTEQNSTAAHLEAARILARSNLT